MEPPRTPGEAPGAGAARWVVGLDEQLHERRMHDALPRAGGDARCGPCPSPSRGPRTTVDTFRKHCHAAGRADELPGLVQASRLS
jgi:hypothetical protein